jgi:hypothetical protein
MAMTAAAEAMKDAKADSKTTTHTILNVGLAAGMSVGDKAVLQSMRDLLSATTDPEALERFVGRQTGALMPSIGAQVARGFDPTMRRKRGFGDYLQARTPGWSRYLAPDRDMYGREAKLMGGEMERVTGSAIPSITPITDPVYQETFRLGVTEAKAGEVLEIADDLTIKGKKYVLTPDEYDDYAKTSGEAAYKAVKAEMDDPSWRQNSDEEKKKLIADAIDEARKEWREEFKDKHWKRISAEAK